MHNTEYEVQADDTASTASGSVVRTLTKALPGTSLSSRSFGAELQSGAGGLTASSKKPFSNSHLDTDAVNRSSSASTESITTNFSDTANPSVQGQLPESDPDLKFSAANYSGASRTPQVQVSPSPHAGLVLPLQAQTAINRALAVNTATSSVQGNNSNANSTANSNTNLPAYCSREQKQQHGRGSVEQIECRCGSGRPVVCFYLCCTFAGYSECRGSRVCSKTRGEGGNPP